MKFLKGKLNFKKGNEYRFVWMNLLFWIGFEYIFFQNGLVKYILELLFILPVTSVLCWFLALVIDDCDFN